MIDLDLYSTHIWIRKLNGYGYLSECKNCKMINVFAQEYKSNFEQYETCNLISCNEMIIKNVLK